MTPPRNRKPADKPADKPAEKKPAGENDGPRPGNLKFRADGTAVLVVAAAKGKEGDDGYTPALVAELNVVEHPGALFAKYDDTTIAKHNAEQEADTA